MILPGDPNGLIERQYRAYGPLFTAVRGSRWYLSPRPAAVTAGTAEVNALVAPPLTGDGRAGAAAKFFFAPVVLGAAGSNVTLALTLDSEVGAKTGTELCSVAVMHPAGDAAAWEPLASVQLAGGAAVVTAPLGPRGGCLVRVRCAS